MLAQADLLLLAASLLRRPEQISLPQQVEREALLDAAGADPSLRGAFNEATTAGEQAAAALSEWSDEYHRLFEGAMACPMNESAFIRRDKGALLADIMGFYTAFGFAPAPDAGEKPDHLCCELEFVAVLLVMQACASQAGRAEEEAITRDALAQFALSHLGAWLDSFVGRLGQVTALPLYAAAGHLLQRTWDLLEKQYGWQRATEQPINLVDDDSTPYECGMAEEGAAIELTLRGQPVVSGRGVQVGE